MKILMVVHSFLPDAFAGVEIHAYHLARLLRERHDVIVLHRIEDEEAPEGSYTFGQYKEIPVVRLVNNHTLKSRENLDITPGMRERFAEILDQLLPDVVHFQHLGHLSTDLVDEVEDREIPTLASLHDYWYICARVQLYVPGKGRCPGPSIFRCTQCFNEDDELVRSMSRFAFLGDRAARCWMNACTHIDWPAAMRLMVRRLEGMRDLLGRFHLILANSRHTRRRHIRFGVPARRIRVLRCGIDTRRLAEARHEPAVNVRFGYIGSIMEHKGIELLVKAFRRVPEASCKIWGDPAASQEAVKLFESLDVPENVRFMDGFEQKEIDGVLSRIDVLVVPSIWEEAYGLTVDEAKAAGIPVIASRIGGIPEHLHHGKEGFLFKPGDADELERVIRRLAGRPDRVEALQPSGDDVMNLFDNAREVEEAYLEVLRMRNLSGADARIT
jgi:glycosyltransferase involved in cell wall biosynthesis